jgi:hypothetical protein
MIISLRILFLLGLTVFVVPQAKNLRISVNLMPDGGFESKQWNLTKWEKGEAELSFSNEGRSGEKAVRLTGISNEEANINILAYSPPISVQERHDYVLTLWYRSTENAGPLVTIASFEEEWAPAKWETPKTDNRTLGQQSELDALYVSFSNRSGNGPDYCHRPQYRGGNGLVR